MNVNNNKKFRHLVSMADSFPSVQPQSHPNENSLFTLETTYSTYTPLSLERTYIVDEFNIESTKVDFSTEDVQIGDQVIPFDMGGWEALAGRAGISLMRNGVELKSKLTKIS
jgi:hypothetical protein